MKSSLSFVIFELEVAAIGLYMYGFLAIIAYPIVLGLVSTSCIVQLSGRTSSTNYSVGRPNLILCRCHWPNRVQMIFSELLSLW